MSEEFQDEDLLIGIQVDGFPASCCLSLLVALGFWVVFGLVWWQAGFWWAAGSLGGLCLVGSAILTTICLTYDRTRVQR